MAAKKYNRKKIGWELERTAMGDGYYGNALRVAKDLPEITAEDKAVLDRWLTGKNKESDFFRLQDIAIKVYNTPESNPAKKKSAKRKATPAQLAALKKGRAKLMAKRARKNPTTRKKKATVRKKIAVNAKSRATGKAPSARLKKRRARNTVPGAYPNPKARTGYLIFVVNKDGVVLFNADDRFTSQRRAATHYSTKAAAEKEARRIARDFAAPLAGLAMGVADYTEPLHSIRFARSPGK